MRVNQRFVRSNLIWGANYFQRLRACERLTLHSNRGVLVNIVSRRRPRLKRRERRRCLRNIVWGVFSPEKPVSQDFKYMRVNQRFVRSNLTWGAKQFTSEILKQEVDLPYAGTVAKWPKWRYRPLSHEIFKTARATRSSSPRLLFSVSLQPLFVWLTAECAGKTQPLRFRVDVDVPLGRRSALNR